MAAARGRALWGMKAHGCLGRIVFECERARGAKAIRGKGVCFAGGYSQSAHKEPQKSYYLTASQAMCFKS